MERKIVERRQRLGAGSQWISSLPHRRPARAQFTNRADAFANRGCVSGKLRQYLRPAAIRQFSLEVDLFEGVRRRFTNQVVRLPFEVR